MSSGTSQCVLEYIPIDNWCYRMALNLPRLWIYPGTFDVVIKDTTPRSPEGKTKNKIFCNDIYSMFWQHSTPKFFRIKCDFNFMLHQSHYLTKINCLSIRMVYSNRYRKWLPEKIYVFFEISSELYVRK